MTELVGPVEFVERVDERDRVLGVVERWEAVRRGWLHRIAATVCRDAGGRVLVHRRADGLARFPGRYDWLVGGAVDVGESWEEAAVRELAEELGVRVDVRFAFKFLCRKGISPYWLGVHEAVLDQQIVADPAEIAWHGWVDEGELWGLTRRLAFVPDGVEVLRRLRAGAAAGAAGIAGVDESA